MLSDHFYVDAILHPVIVSLLDLPIVTHYAVRPGTQVYDQSYWQQNYAKMEKNRWHPGQPTHIYRRTTIQEWERTFEAQELARRKDLSMVYQLFDVHYYLGGWKPLWKDEKHEAHVVGGNFHSVPGWYPLPNNEGHYTLDGEGNIFFKPRGTALPYCHK